MDLDMGTDVDVVEHANAAACRSLCLMSITRHADGQVGQSSKRRMVGGGPKGLRPGDERVRLTMLALLSVVF